MTDLPIVFLLAGAGLMVGSFINVCIYRLPRGQSIAWPPSYCTACRRSLRWFENVPVLGWLLLGGRCRTCGERISFVYPVIELVTPATFLLQYWQFGWQSLLVVRLVFVCAMLILFVIDLRHRILPDVITLPGVFVGIVASFVFEPGWFDAVVGAAIGAGSLLAIAEVYYRVRGEEGLGMGDVKMLAMIGAFLGWQLTLTTVIIASLTGALVGGIMVSFDRANMKYPLPLGSFLAASAVIAAHVGQPLVEWYLGFY